MKLKLPTLIIISIVAIIAIIAAIILIYPNIETTPQNNTAECESDNCVVRVIDGDTFKLSSGDIIRLLCIDAPELKAEGGQEAKLYLENLILGKEVRLEGNETDKYNRSLKWAYVDYGDGSVFVNGIMVEQDYADIFVYENTNCDRLTG